MTVVFFLTGCDTLFVKRFDLQRPINSSLITNYEVNKDKIISAIDHVASDYNLSCRKRQGVFRDCKLQPKSIVAFEDNQGFTTCLFMLGMPFEESKFVQLADALEKALKDSVTEGAKLSISPTEKLPECKVPKEIQ
ncbi:MAG: hypothetical protein ABSB19_08205 [Methylomonas sp.]|jgi:hypothetical protein